MGRGAKRKERYRVTPKVEREQMRGRVPRGFVPCTKITYASKTAAKEALRVLQGKRRQQRAAGLGEPGKGAEQSAYRCPECRLWHLTHWQQGGPGGRVLSRSGR